MSLKTEITGFLKGQGASLVGIAGIDRFDGAPRGHLPAELLPEARTVVSMGVKLPARLVDWDGLLSGSEVIPDEVKWEVECSHWYARCGYEAMNIKLEQLGLSLTLYLEEHGHEAICFPATYAHHAEIMRKIPGYFAPFSHRHAAVRAGLGEFGFNNLVITPQFGPRVRFMSVITSAELEPDPLQVSAICLGEKCLACIKACGIPGENLHAITPVGKRESGIFLNMPSVVDKPACYYKYDEKAHCWGKCIAACPIGK